MPLVNVKGVGNIQFPDGMSAEDINAAIKKDILPKFPEIGAKVPRTWGEAATDLGASLTKGVGSLLQTPGQLGQLAGIYAPEQSKRGLQGLGEELEAYGQGLKSPTLQAKEALRGAKIAQAEEQGMFPAFTTAIGQTIKDPALLGSFFTEQLPNLAGSWGGGLLTRGVTKALMSDTIKASLGSEGVAKALGTAGTRGAIGTNAIMQGADIGSETYETIYKQLKQQYPDMSDEERNGIALSKARVAAIESAALSVAASKLPGGATIERAMAGKGLPGAGGITKGLFGEALSESFEEGTGKFASNIGVQEVFPETSLTKGIGSAAGLGALGGGIFGGAAGVRVGGQEADRLQQEQFKLAKLQQAEQEARAAIAEAQQAEDAQRRAEFAAEQHKIELAALKERSPFENSAAYADLVASVDKAKAARDKADAKKAEFSAFAEANPDLFGMYTTQQEAAAANVPQAQNIPQEGQLELPLANQQGQLALPIIGDTQNVAPIQEEMPVPETRPVTEADFKAMGIGSTNTKLREALLGKDLADPAQMAEVKTALEEYAGGKNRSGKIIEGVSNFLAQPAFQEQLDLGLRRAPTRKAKGVESATRPTGPIAGAAEPSVRMANRPAGIAEGVNAPQAEGLGSPVVGAGQAVAGEGNVNAPLTGKFDGFMSWLSNKGISPTDNTQDWKALENQWHKESAANFAEMVNPSVQEEAKPVKEATEPKKKLTKQEEREAQYIKRIEADVAKGQIKQPADMGQMMLDYVAGDIYSGEHTSFGKNFFADATPVQKTYIADKISYFRKLQDAGKRAVDRHNEQQKLERLEPPVNPEVQRSLFGSTSPALIVAIDQGNLTKALAVIANDTEAFSKIDNLVAKRILNNKSFRMPNFELVDDLNGASGQYIPYSDTVRIARGEADSHTVLHEVTHSFLHSLIGAFEAGKYSNAGLTNLKAIYEHVQKNAPELVKEYGMTNLSEFASEVMSNETFQNRLKNVPYRRGNIFTAFARAVMQILGLADNDVMNAFGAALIAAESSLNAGRNYQETQITGKQEVTPAQLAKEQEADSLLGAVKAPVVQPGPFQQIKNYSPEQAKTATRNFLDVAQTMMFSADAGLSNRIARELEKSGTDWEVVKDAMFQISTAQSLHADAVANLFLEHGNIKYDEKAHKYFAEDAENKASWRGLIHQIQDVAEQYGVSVDKMNAYANRAFIADRLKGLARTKQEVFSHLTPQEIDDGVKLFEVFPELRKVQDTWNGVRQNAMKVAVDAGLYSKEQAEELLQYMDYVPFYRADQIAVKGGPREYNRGLLDFAKNFKIKGSEQEVSDIFDNMERWTSYTISRAVKNRTALNMYKVAKDLFPDEVRELRQDERVKREQNVVELWVDGQRQKVEFTDPLFVHAFEGVQSVAIPSLTWAAKAGNIFRKSIVLNPVFSLSQLSQDAVSAMFTSGLRNPFAIPVEVVKEFIKTLRGTSTSAKDLGLYGAVGVRDYSSMIARNEAEILAGFKKPTRMQKFLSPFEKFAMASDNAVRQAIYNRTIAEGGTKAEAIEKAFEVINFKRAGASAGVQILRQVVPFFGAYLQAQNVAYKVLTGKGISPSQRKEAHKVLLATTAKIMALGFIYAAMCADDDDYQNMDPTIRDRHLLIPGTGFMLPLRSDVFLFPKLMAEYTYLGMTDNGFTDAKKITRAMKNAVSNAILSPTLVPQIAKPTLEVMVNYDFFTGRPIVGKGLEERPTEQQYSTHTSEFAKFLGQSGAVSPLNVDHLIKGYFGTTGGLALMVTNKIAELGSDKEAPEKSFRDTVASIPGMGAFVARENGNAIKNDFYELRKDVTVAVNGFNNLKKSGTPEELDAYIEKNKDLLQLKSGVNKLNKELSRIRDYEKFIYNDKEMSGAEKREALKELKETEKAILSQVHDMRSLAGYDEFIDDDED